MTLPNALTLTRAVCAIAVPLAVLQNAWGLASVLFVWAVLSDFMDGMAARHLNQVTNLGGLLDHASDACFVSLCLAALAIQGEIPALLPPLIAVAFTQYVVDSRAHRGRQLRASKLGRWNGIAYFGLAGLPLFRESLGLPFPDTDSVRIVGWVLVATTLASILDRATAKPKEG